MRPVKLPIRFAMIFAMLVAFAAPASAKSPPDGLFGNAARQPVFHRTQSSGVTMSHLRIPAIGVDETIRSGVALSVIDRGVAHWSGTASPGGVGNVVLAGHRTTKSRPFYDLDHLDPGDLVFLEDGSGFEVMYRVSDAYVVDPKDLWITYDRETPTLTMFACHPKGSARYRIVVNADLVAGRKIT